MTKFDIKHNRTKTAAAILSSLMIGLTLSLSGFIPSLSIPQTFATSASTGIMEPLYCDPYGNDGSPCAGCTGTSFCWQPLVDARTNHPNVPIFAIVNPNSGPCYTTCNGTVTDFKNGITTLTNAGVVVLGYVDTCLNDCTSPQTQKTLSAVETDVDRWNTYYGPSSTLGSHGVKGIFYDDMLSYSVNSTTNELQYFQSLTSYIHGKGFTYSIGNPGGDATGTSVNSNYVDNGTADVLNTWENGSVPTASDMQRNTFVTDNGNNDGFAKSNFALLSFCVGNPGQTQVGNASNYFGLLYFTNYIGCTSTNPWNGISSYLSTLARYLDKPSAMITIDSVNSSGKQITQYEVIVDQNGHAIPSGYTPLPYNGTSGVRYYFTPQDFGGCNFNHWQDNNSPNANRTILVNSTSATFTAVYSGTCP